MDIQIRKADCSDSTFVASCVPVGWHAWDFGEATDYLKIALRRD